MFVFVLDAHADTSGLTSETSAESGRAYFKKDAKALHDREPPTSSNS